MAHTEWIEGTYTIPRGQTVSFDFWWPGGGFASEYFDVWIAPYSGVDIEGGHVGKEVPLRLRQTGREMIRIFDANSNETRYILQLTITNEEPNIDVTFVANHVRITP
jgi:hypothetical protein